MIEHVCFEYSMQAMVEIQMSHCALFKPGSHRAEFDMLALEY